MTINKVSSESPFYFQLIHVNNIWNIKTVFMQNGYRLQWYGIFPPFLIRYLAQLGLLVLLMNAGQVGLGVNSAPVNSARLYRSDPIIAKYFHKGCSYEVCFI